MRGYVRRLHANIERRIIPFIHGAFVAFSIPVYTNL